MALKVKAVEKKIKFNKQDEATKVFTKNGSNIGSGGFDTGQG